VPNDRGRLAAGGTLQMLAIEGQPQYNARLGQTAGEPLDVVWVTIDVPDPAVAASVFQQGFAKGGAAFARLEGAWYGRGRIFFTSTNGGNTGQGQVWEYEPSSDTLRARVRVAGGRGAELARQHHGEPARRPGALRGRQRRRVPARPDDRRRHLPVRAEQRRPERRAERDHRRLPRQRVRGSDLQSGRSVDFFKIQTPGITFAITGP
jgi:uncharacterized protein